MANWANELTAATVSIRLPCYKRKVPCWNHSLNTFCPNDSSLMDFEGYFFFLGLTSQWKLRLFSSNKGLADYYGAALFDPVLAAQLGLPAKGKLGLGRWLSQEMRGSLVDWSMYQHDLVWRAFQVFFYNQVKTTTPLMWTCLKMHLLLASHPW